MKRFYVAIVLAGLIAALSNCSAPSGGFRSDAPSPVKAQTQTPVMTLLPSETIRLTAADTPEPSPTPDADTIQPPEGPASYWGDDDYYKLKKIVPTTNVYKSSNSGITFTVPESWVGRYRVEEQEDYITVFFNPMEPIDGDVGDGTLFSVDMKYSELDELRYGKAVEFDIDGATYICGTPKYDSYQQG